MIHVHQTSCLETTSQTLVYSTSAPSIVVVLVVTLTHRHDITRRRRTDSTNSRIFRRAHFHAPPSLRCLASFASSSVRNVYFNAYLSLLSRNASHSVTTRAKTMPDSRRAGSKFVYDSIIIDLRSCYRLFLPFCLQMLPYWDVCQWVALKARAAHDVVKTSRHFCCFSCSQCSAPDALRVLNNMS